MFEKEVKQILHSVNHKATFKAFQTYYVHSILYTIPFIEDTPADWDHGMLLFFKKNDKAI